MRPFEPALLRRVPQARLPVAALSATGVVGGVLAVAQAVCLAWLVTRVVTGGDLVVPLTAAAALLTARGLVAGVQESVAGWAGHRVASAVRLAVLRRWAGRPEGARPEPEEAVTTAGEGVSAIEPYVARYLPALVAGAVVPALSLLVLAVVDVWSAIVVVLTLPLLPLFAALIGRHTQDETQRRWRAMTDLAGHFLDVVRGLPTLVAYGRAGRQVRVVAEVGRRHRVATVRTLRTAFLSTVALELLATISVALVAVCVGLRLAYGAMELQVALTAILLAPEAYWPVRRVGAEFHNAADGAEALERLKDQLGPAPETGPGEAPLAVRVEDVTYSYPGRDAVLRGVHHNAGPGPGLVVLTAPSGSGKTTLLELLAGLRVPDAGRVVAPRAHLATQRPLLLPGTVRENLALAAPDATDGEMTVALQRVGLWPVLAGRAGLETRLGDDGFGLSAGQRGRLALARAVLSDAPLVLLDEPTAHIAAGSRRMVLDVVRDLARRRLVVVATHDPLFLEVADHHWTLPAPDERPTEVPAPAAASDARSLPEPEGAADATAPLTASEDEDSWWSRRLSRRQRLWLGAILGGLATASGVALTALSGWLIVQASYRPVVLTLLVAIVGVRAFGIARPVLRYAERVVSHDAALAELADRRTEVYRRLIPLTPARLGRRSRGDVLTAVVRDLDDVVDERVRVFVPAVGTALASAVAAGIVGSQVPAAGWVVALGTLTAYGIGRLGQAVEQAAHDDAVTHRGAVRRLVALVCGQLTAVQAVTGEAGRATLLDRVRRAQDRADRAARRLSLGRGGAVAGTWLVVAAVVGTVATLAGAAYRAGEVSGPVAALVALTPVALAEAWTALPDVFGARARAASARRRLQRVLDQEPAVVDRSGGHWPSAAPTRPTLVTEGVTARWTPGRAGEPDLLATDLLVAPGDRVLLTGPNGAGKSTLLAVLARDLDPESGRYRHDADDVLRLDLERTRARIARVDDEPHAFAGSVRANLLLAREDATDAEIVAALAAADLGTWLAGLPDGLDTRLTGLSGGERARLAIARALLSGRPVLLLDEPTAHLDAVTARTVLHRLGGDERTVVMVSHDGAALLRDEATAGSWRVLDLADRPGVAAPAA